MNKLEIKTLKDLVSFLSRGITPNYSEEGIPVINQRCIRENKVIYTECRFTHPSTKISSNKYLRSGDILVNSTGTGTLGRSAVYRSDIPYITVDGHVTILRPNENVVPLYLGYYLHYIESYLDVLGRGATNQKELVSSDLKRIKIPLPDLATQKKIADILSAYDDLIENNLARISLLEKMASELYKEWFVRFRFPGHEAAKFVDGVPEGWEYHKLKDIADIVMGQSPESSYYNSDGEGLPFHQGVTNYGGRYVSNVEYCSVGKRYALPNSILFSVRAPVGRINLTREKVIIGRGLSALNHKLGKQSYLFYLLKSHFSVEDMIGNGSVFSSVTKSELEKQKLLIPPSNLIEMFSQIVEPIDDMINCLDMQVEMLRKTRDLLLPRLMSGKLSVDSLVSETA